MKNNKLLTIMLIILVALLLVGVVITILFLTMNKGDEEAKEPPIEDVVAASVDIPEITTNLSDNHFIKMQLKIQTDSEDAAGELTQRIFQVNNIAIQELSDMTSEDLKGKQGKITVENTLKAKINELMQTGEVQRVYITAYINQ